MVEIQMLKETQKESVKKLAVLSIYRHYTNTSLAKLRNEIDKLKKELKKT